MSTTLTRTKTRFCGLAVATLATVALGIGAHAQKVQAAELPIQGASAKDAIITTDDGKNVTGQTNLNKYVYYNANYQWSLPQNVTVKNGDTAHFGLPNNVEVRVADTKFEVKNEKNQTVGTFDIKKGSHTGKLTFNSYFANHKMKDIRGRLSFKVSGTEENAPGEWFLNKSGWLDNENHANWTVVYNPQSKHLTNVHLDDILRNGQTYVDDSIQLWYGHVENNQFVAEEKITDPVKKGLVHVSKNNDILSFYFKKLDKAVQLYYKTNPGTKSQYKNLDLVNVVDASCDQIAMNTISCKIAVGGSGTADGTQKPNHPDCKPDWPDWPDWPGCPDWPIFPDWPCWPCNE